MEEYETERQVNIKFLARLKRSQTETFQLLTETYSDECSSYARISEQNKRFSEVTESVKDDHRQLDFPSRQCTSHRALSVRHVLANNSVIVLVHPPYSPDLASSDFYVLQKITFLF